MPAVERFEAVITPTPDGVWELTVIHSAMGGVSGPWLSEPLPHDHHTTMPVLTAAAEQLLAPHRLHVAGPWTERPAYNGPWLYAPLTRTPAPCSPIRLVEWNAEPTPGPHHTGGHR